MKPVYWILVGVVIAGAVGVTSILILKKGQPQTVSTPNPPEAGAVLSQPEPKLTLDYGNDRLVLMGACNELNQAPPAKVALRRKQAIEKAVEFENRYGEDKMRAILFQEWEKDFVLDFLPEVTFYRQRAEFEKHVPDRASQAETEREHFVFHFQTMQEAAPDTRRFYRIRAIAYAALYTEKYGWEATRTIVFKHSTSSEFSDQFLSSVRDRIETGCFKE